MTLSEVRTVCLCTLPSGTWRGQRTYHPAVGGPEGGGGGERGAREEEGDRGE